MKSRSKQQPLQQLMSMDVKPTEQLIQILNDDEPNEKNIIKINKKYSFEIEFDEDEVKVMEDSSSHESFMYAYERLMEKKKELEDNISVTEIFTGKGNVLENKTRYYIKEPMASFTDELRTNGQNDNTERDPKISIQSPCIYLNVKDRVYN